MQKPNKSTKPFSQREEYMAYLLRLSARAFQLAGIDTQTNLLASPSLVKEFLIENGKEGSLYEL